MNESTEPRPDDELVSAVLDGVASPAETDRVMGDAQLTARLAELRSARDAVAEPADLLDPATVDQLVGRALEHFGDAEEDVDAASDGSGWTGGLPDWSHHAGPARPKDQIAARRGRRATDPSGRRRIPPLAAAAALLVVAGIGLFIALHARSQRNHSATSTLAQAPAAPDARGSSGYGPPLRAVPETGNGLVWLGVFPDQASLTRTLTQLDARTLLPASTTNEALPGSAAATGGAGTGAGAAATPSPPTPPTTYLPDETELNRCDSVIRLSVKRPLTNRLAAGGAELANRAVLLVTYEAPATKTQAAGVAIVVADQLSCYPVLEQDH